MSETSVVAVREPLGALHADALVLGIVPGEPLRGAALEVDQASSGLLGRLIANEDFAAKAYEVLVVPAPAGLNAQRLVLAGLGPADAIDARIAYRTAAAAAKSIAGKPRRRVVYAWDALPQELVADAVAGALNGCRGQDLLRQEKKIFPFAELGWAGDDEAALRQGDVLGRATVLARRLINLPASDIYPESFAMEAEQVADRVGLDCEVWDEIRLKEERCGALLAVAQGSSRPARLVMLRHQGGGDDAPWTALVGKGVTFDSGGLSLKPNESMLTMKCDMAGAATVLAAMQAIAELKLPVNIMGLCGLAENMVSGDSFKLGDVLRSRNGKTIEVLNTDAEGRLVLADVLDVAVSRGAKQIIDLATLTGACVVALGTDIAGLMTNDLALGTRIQQAAQRCGERVWPLPMHAEFAEQIRSNVADIKNVGNGRWGGAITAAKFLEEFVGDAKWAHLDIAGPAFLDRPTPWCDGGATGALVRTVVGCW